MSSIPHASESRFDREESQDEEDEPCDLQQSGKEASTHTLLQHGERQVAMAMAMANNAADTAFTDLRL